MSAFPKKFKAPWFRRHAVNPGKPRSPASSEGKGWRFWTGVGAGAVVLLAFYFWMTTAKILEEPVKIEYGPLSPPFAESMGALLGAPFFPGNAVAPLLNGDGIFPPMLEAIRSAKKTITLETYIWTSGKVSDQFIDALTERARNGVKVHVLADGMGTLKFKDEDQQRLLDAGVEYVVYGREHWWEIKPNINHRTHRKILVVDGKVGFTGGMCIDDHWLGNAESTEVWRETGVRVEGPAVRQMQGVFSVNWMQTTARLLVGPDYFPGSTEIGSTLVQCFKSGPSEDPENSRVAYLLAIASARTSIKISHAYFVPDDLAIRMLLDARQRGVRVQVIIPAVNDSRFGRGASRSRWGPLLAGGVEFHQYLPAMLHCKVMIVDDVFVTLGSVNFDNRSFAINDEMNVSILDRAAARAYVKIFEDDLGHSRAYPLAEFEGRPWWLKTADKFCGLFRSQF